MTLNLEQRMMTRHFKKKVLQDESQLNCVSSEVKEQISELCKSSIKRKVTLEEKSSQNSDLLEDNNKVENIEWIMCDECQKWRKISCEDAKDFHGNRKWFCFLNKNFAFNQCLAPEECYSDLIKRMQQKNLYVVIYGLQLGDLVWAKMSSYPRWPSLITCDPQYGEFVCGQPGYEAEYHVEFLGPQHSHAWIKGSYIELYRETDSENILISEKKSKKKKLQSLRNIRQYNHLQSAIKEAKTLLDVTNNKRMKFCVFENADGKYSVAESQMESRKYKDFPINKSTYKKPYKNDSTITQICSKPDRRKSNKCCIYPMSPSNTQYSSEQTERVVMPCYNTTDPKNSLLTLTPQERLSLDIEVYKKSEVAFRIDLKQFLARNNLNLEMPFWENIPVNSYQLFQSVNELGGYEIVTRKSKWSNIYQEITNTHLKYKGKVAKKYYYRNLYAYALYISGKSYEHIIHEILSEENKQDKSFGLEKPQKKTKIVQHKPEEDFFNTFYAKFEELENANRMCYFEEEIKSAEKELGISIRFHDEPTLNSPLHEYEFPLDEDAVFSDDSHALITEDSRVPDIYNFDNQSDKYWKPKSSSNSNSNQSLTDSDNASINLDDFYKLSDQIDLISCKIDL